MFRQSGQFTAKIIDVMIADAKFANQAGPNAFDVCLKVRGPDFDGQPQEDWWRGEISGRVAQKGNFQGHTQHQITMKDLEKIGFDDPSLETLETLKGKEIPITVERNEYKGKEYFNVRYIGNDYAPTPVDKSDMKKRLAALGGDVTTQSSSDEAAEGEWL